nr:hypothetical protein [Tanacetum cinerariifolium]
MSSSSQKKPLHAKRNRQCGSHVAGSSLLRMLRNTSTPKQEDVTNFLQCSRVDPKAMASEYKFNSHGDFKKLANDVLAPIASPDDLKKLKAGLRESITKAANKAEERVISTTPNKWTRTSKVDVYREPKQGIYPRNLLDSRSRPTDTFGSRPGAASISAHSSTPKPEQKSKTIRVKDEERVISTAPNKRTRTSKVDGYREPKQGIYPRNLPDSRSRPTDTFGSRIGVREEYTAGGPTNAKPVRGPRSRSMVAARFSTVQAPASNDQELPNTTSKNSGPVGPTNRKRTLSASSSSSLSCYGPKAPGGKSAGTKLVKKQALATVKQTLEQCNEFETTSKSNFTDNESGQRCPQIIPFEAAISNGVKGKRSISSVSKVEDDEPPLDFSHLEIPKMDVFGDAIGEQSLDVGSW